MAEMKRDTPGFFDIDERLAKLSAKGDDLERLSVLVDFEMFRAALEAAVPRGDRWKGGRPPFDHVLMFKVLILQGDAFAVGRTLRVSDQGPAVVHAFSWPWARGRCSRRQYDLDIPEDWTGRR